MSKRQIKSRFRKGEIGFSHAVPALMFDHQMERGAAMTFLMS